VSRGLSATAELLVLSRMSTQQPERGRRAVQYLLNNVPDAVMHVAVVDDGHPTAEKLTK